MFPVTRERGVYGKNSSRRRVGGAGTQLVTVCKNFLKKHQAEIGIPEEKISAVAFNLAKSAYRSDEKLVPLPVACSETNWTECARFREFSSESVLMRLGETVHLEWDNDHGNIEGQVLVMKPTEKFQAVGKNGCQIEVGGTYRTGENREYQVRVTSFSYVADQGWFANVDVLNDPDLFDAIAVAHLEEE